MVDVLRARPGELRLHDRARLVHHEARGRRCGRPRRPRSRSGASTRARPRSTRARAARPAGPRRRTEATIEATSVVVRARRHARRSASSTALTDDGRRVLANARDADVLRDMTADAWEGRRVKITNDGIDQHASPV